MYHRVLFFRPERTYGVGSHPADPFAGATNAAAVVAPDADHGAEVEVEMTGQTAAEYDPDPVLGAGKEEAHHATALSRQRLAGRGTRSACDDLGPSSGCICDGDGRRKMGLATRGRPGDTGISFA